MATERARLDPNRNPVIQGVTNDANLFPTDVRIDPVTLRLLVSGTVTSAVVPGLNIPAYDYVSNATTSTSDTYSFKSGGSGGSLVATVAVVYTDSGKGTISTVTKT